MDELRLAHWPGPQTRESRAKAYERMHELAAKELRHGASGVILVATYQPSNQRHAVKALAERARAQLIICECNVTPTEAVRRFTARTGLHAATDLTAEKVWDLAHDFPYNEKAVCLNTTDKDASMLADLVTARVLGPRVTLPPDWIDNGLVPPPASEPTGRAELRLTPRSRANAKTRQRQRYELASVTGIPVAVALLILIGTLTSRFSLPPVLARLLQPFLVSDATDWIQTWLGIAASIAGAGAAWQYFIKSDEATRDEMIASAGLMPRFEFHDAEPSNPHVYERYKRRIKPAQRDRLLIGGLPLWFLIPPVNGTSITTRSASEPMMLDEKRLHERAAAHGLDWHAFMRRRTLDKEREYPDPKEYREKNVRVTNLVPVTTGYVLEVADGDYFRYVSTELAANLVTAEGLELREILEGPPWRQSAHPGSWIDLEDIAGASTTHEMLLSIHVGLTTSDGYLVLQRRSPHVESAVGGVASSAAGAVQREDLQHRYGVLQAALRELKEEIGWTPHGGPWQSRWKLRDWHRRPQPDTIDPTRAFLGAAFNLLRGRDLNLYCHLHTHQTFAQISEAARFARDAWEHAHLIPVPLTQIPGDGTLTPWLADIIRDARHVRGMLYCFAISGRLQEIRERTTGASGRGGLGFCASGRDAG